MTDPGRSSSAADSETNVEDSKCLIPTGETNALRNQSADSESVREIERLREENLRLRRMVEDYVPMVGPDFLAFEVNGPKLTLTGATKIVETMADSMSLMLADAPNYVEVEMRAAKKGGDSYTLTIRRRNRPTPHELRQQADARAEAAESEVAALREQLRQVEELCDEADRYLPPPSLIVESLRSILSDSGGPAIRKFQHEHQRDDPPCAICSFPLPTVLGRERYILSGSGEPEPINPASTFIGSDEGAGR